jgi:hypothetical protein
VERSRRLQVLTAVCSVVFAIGTALQTFVIIDNALVIHAMQLAGTPDATAQAPGFVAALRTVGVGYLIGNALGVLALGGRAWVYWLVLTVNTTQAAGVVAGFVPPVVLQASIDLHGPVGVLPTLVTDGGAAGLVLVLLAFAVRYRGPWARGDHRRWAVEAS